MALSGAFTATGQYSTVWYGMGGGFDVGVTITAGTNALKIEQEIGGVWYTVGSAITATGRVHKAHEIDYAAPSRFRLNGGTFDTGPITYQIEGDILAPEITSDSVFWSILLETGDDLLLESGEYWLLESA